MIRYELYKSFNTPQLFNLYKQLILIFVYKFVYHRYKLFPVYNDYFLSNNLIHDHNTIRDQNLYLCSISISFGQRSIKCQGYLLWGQLPSYCQDIQSAYCFQSKIRELLSTGDIC